jgi:hypothetical protein
VLADASDDSTPTSLPEGRRSRSEHNEPRSSPANAKDSHYVARAVYFIDFKLHAQAQLALPKPDLSMPAGLCSLMDDLPSIREISGTYFATIHPWLPIISKHNFYTRLMNPLAGRRTELGLLTLSMKLCCSAPPAGSAPETGLYNSVKTFHGDAERAGLLSINLLQAKLLTALYEIGQAIYPAAYLSVGACKSNRRIQ